MSDTTIARAGRRAFIFALAAFAFALCALSQSPRAKADTADVARGLYLTGPAGQCSDCHGDNLQGGELGFLKPGLPVKYRAPRIAGLPRHWSREQTAHFLESGRTPDGKPAAPPMPRYRFSHDDAEAIAAYLASAGSAR